MSRIGKTRTGPELKVAALLSEIGVRFRFGGSGLPGSPDLANKSRKWAIFVHGCFWHGHPGCAAARLPKRNHALWLLKVRDNRKRDRRKLRELGDLGFRTFVVWGCELRDGQDTHRAVRSRIARFVRPIPAPDCFSRRKVR